MCSEPSPQPCSKVAVIGFLNVYCAFPSALQRSCSGRVLHVFGAFPSALKEACSDRVLYVFGAFPSALQQNRAAAEVAVGGFRMDSVLRPSLQR